MGKENNLKNSRVQLDEKVIPVFCLPCCKESVHLVNFSHQGDLESIIRNRLLFIRASVALGFHNFFKFLEGADARNVRSTAVQNQFRGNCHTHTL